MQIVQNRAESIKFEAFQQVCLVLESWDAPHCRTFQSFGAFCGQPGPWEMCTFDLHIIVKIWTFFETIIRAIVSFQHEGLDWPIERIYFAVKNIHYLDTWACVISIFGAYPVVPKKAWLRKKRREEGMWGYEK